MQLYVYPENLYNDARKKNAFNLKKDDFLPNIQTAMQVVWDNGGIVRFKDSYKKMEVSIMEEK